MTTPFWLDAVDFNGQDPGVPASWRVDEHTFWLGTPGMMVQLPSPNTDAYTVTWSSGRVAHALFGGGQAVTRFASRTRTWSLHWLRLAGRDAQILHAFDTGVFGEEWCFVPPEYVNRLTRKLSLCDVTAWGPRHGSIDQTPGAPVAVVGGTAMLWTPASAGDLLGAAPVDLTHDYAPDLDHAAPYLPGEPATFSAWLQGSGGSAAVTLRLSGRAGDGTVIAEASSAPVTAGTSGWTLAAVTADIGALGAASWIIPEFVTGDGHPVNISNPQLDYWDSPRDWEIGMGVPRVQSLDPGSTQTDAHTNLNVTWQLVESVTGAA